MKYTAIILALVCSALAYAQGPHHRDRYDGPLPRAPHHHQPSPDYRGPHHHPGPDYRDSRHRHSGTDFRDPRRHHQGSHHGHGARPTQPPPPAMRPRPANSHAQRTAPTEGARPLPPTSGPTLIEQQPKAVKRSTVHLCPAEDSIPSKCHVPSCPNYCGS